MFWQADNLVHGFFLLLSVDSCYFVMELPVQKENTIEAARMPWWENVLQIVVASSSTIFQRENVFGI